MIFCYFGFYRATCPQHLNLPCAGPASSIGSIGSFVTIIGYRNTEDFCHRATRLATSPFPRHGKRRAPARKPSVPPLCRLPYIFRRGQFKIVAAIFTYVYHVLEIDLWKIYWAIVATITGKITDNMTTTTLEGHHQRVTHHNTHNQTDNQSLPCQSYHFIDDLALEHQHRQ